MLEEDPVLPNTAAVNTSAADAVGLTAGRVTASAASTIPCLTKCIFQQPIWSFLKTRMFAD